MTTILDPLVGRLINVITKDGRVFVGKLRGFDQATNLVLESCHERVFSEDASVDKVQLGLYLLRGDCTAVVGEIDEDVDWTMDLSLIRAAPLKPMPN
eukprot:CAMPEP_0113849722 /NCGR_PEP_ID=MMETSP0372-20130328/3341_1 /TAXON_ID=340204 /ORGANISM="Lankesteria abbotti" /LENGTH=96 /DNA_ID=CAMNT_0000819649 /DNA_START=40 /DNA_END=330 /DNA_ORIENTATION=+ /assembly_acc=CAM_ASM_000359